MKKLISLAVLSIVPMIFTACGQNADKGSFVGYWQGEANTIFEVLTENGQDFIIRNIHGDLTAKIEDGELRGKNDMDMAIPPTTSSPTSRPATRGFPRTNTTRFLRRSRSPRSSKQNGQQPLRYFPFIVSTTICSSAFWLGTPLHTPLI